MLKKWFISAFPEIEKISQNLGPKLGQNCKKLNNENWITELQWKGASDPKSKTSGPTEHRFFSRFFAFPEIDITMLKKWFITEPFFAFSKDITMLKRAFPEIQKSGPISQNLGPKIRPKIQKIKKNWIFNEKVHRMRKTSENRFSLFR